MTPTPTVPPSNRLASLDVFRGATVAFMILVNNPGSGASVYPPLRHASWNGWTPTDLVFPFFLFIVGVAMTFSFARRIEQGRDRGLLLRHALRRGATIFGIGFLLNLIPKFDFEHVRVLGVLQRIGLCYMIGSAIYLYTTWKGQIAWAVALIGGYWAAMTLIPVPGFGPGVLMPEGNLEQFLDAKLLAGHLYSGTKIFDPEGILSTFPAVGNVLIGALIGQLLRSGLAFWLPPVGAGLAITGQIVNIWFPINKPIWTSSYVLWTCGLAAVSLYVCYWIVDLKGWRKWAKPFEWMGQNALAIYVGSGLLAKTLSLTGAHRWLWDNVFSKLATPINASLLFALAEVSVFFVLAWWLWRRRIFIRL